MESRRDLALTVLGANAPRRADDGHHQTERLIETLPFLLGKRQRILFAGESSADSTRLAHAARHRLRPSEAAVSSVAARTACRDVKNSATALGMNLMRPGEHPPPTDDLD